MAFCFAKNRIKINLRVRVSRFVFIVVVAVLSSSLVYLLWFVFCSYFVGKRIKLRVRVSRLAFLLLLLLLCGLACLFVGAVRSISFVRLLCLALLLFYCGLLCCSGFFSACCCGLGSLSTCSIVNKFMLFGFFSSSVFARFFRCCLEITLRFVYEPCFRVLGYRLFFVKTGHVCGHLLSFRLIKFLKGVGFLGYFGVLKNNWFVEN